MNKNAVIVTGGTIYEEFALQELKKTENKYVIGVDRGVSFLYKHQITPDYIVGDFDSLSEEIVTYFREKTNVPIREFNPVKDYSDTEIAVRLAIEKGCKSIKLLGATGTRLDHVMANIQVLIIPHKEGIYAEILDPHNKICLIEREKEIKKSEMYGKYFSVFPFDGCVEHFSIEGAAYPLKDHTLTPYNSLCVSNQAKEEMVRITFPEGIVILMETRE